MYIGANIKKNEEQTYCTGQVKYVSKKMGLAQE